MIIDKTGNQGVRGNEVQSSAYTDEFYKPYLDRSYRSATVYVSILASVYKPLSVVDFGCGRGAWLKAFKEVGVPQLVGLDGSWNSQDKLIDQDIQFKPVDLNMPIELGCRFELAISLEVAEHLEASSASDFVKSLTRAADVVMFGAAYPEQGGTDHINEQPHTYWADMFSECGYLPYDLFRSTVWGSNDVEFWYQQNTFLYVNSRSQIFEALRKTGHQPMTNIAFMNCVHPLLYNQRLLSHESTKSMMGELLKRAMPKKLRPHILKIKRQLW